MTTRKSLRLVSGLLALTLLFTCGLFGSMAKYTSSATGESSARVALWDVRVNNERIGTVQDQEIAFNLFDTLMEENLVDAEQDVKAANGTDKIIAPGTGGAFTMTVANKSEVTAAYSIALSMDATADIPLEFSLDKADWKSSFTEINASLTDRLLPMLTGSEDVSIYWRWKFNGDDAVDTALGLKGTDTITVRAEITVNQVDDSSALGGGSSEPLPEYSPASWFETDGSGKILALTEEAAGANLISIPAEIDGVSITTIGSEVTSSSSDITEVILPSSVTTIDEYAFCGCNNLTKINLSNVTSIGANAFDCCNLSTIDLSSITSIGEMAFMGNVNTINYSGSKNDWYAVNKHEDWNLGCNEIQIICSDGTITVDAKP